MDAPLRCLAFVWGTWLLIWLLAALWTARTVARQSAASRLVHGVLLCAGALLLFSRSTRFVPLQRPLFPPTPWVAWVGVGLAIAGLGFAVWARIHLGRFWSGTVTLKAGHALIRTGPYALTRHPIYTGLLAALTGTALGRGSVAGLLGLGLCVVALVTKLRQEERLLREHFGPAYQEYQAGVPALLPRPWARSR
jgi:protein-S-isoprenylcysteine O-methyltransferase Ste14